MRLEALIRLSNAIEHMEKQMEERLNIEELSRIACMSTFHFQRMFHMLTGLTVAEYVRKRKLTLAAQELASTSIKVIDVALKYGYDTPESFSKAFRKIHGLSPSEARSEGVSLKAFPRISFQISLKGDKEMDYRIEEKESFTVVGKTLQTHCKNGENLREIPLFWQQSNQDGTVDELISLAEDDKTLGICLDMNFETEQFSYMIASRAKAGTTSSTYTVREIPALTWAIFTNIGPVPTTLQKTIARVYQEWFPATGFEHSGGPDMEVYDAGNIMADDYKTEIWVPIIKK
ncbi:AraC family transcriptional regulator [Paenibacillus sp. GSMTC-2017]|uniref:AraC family transcriptional regulator n=1 Tax=Paenibacillus sp. GSMTC-2017 TaxID=2794350 RepID=UPI0018D70167|nr:AraC family transcriptional regulator [Paenibacillus sp. GSMTC-2017]